MRSVCKLTAYSGGRSVGIFRNQWRQVGRQSVSQLDRWIDKQRVVLYIKRVGICFNSVGVSIYLFRIDFSFFMVEITIVLNFRKKIN